MSNLTSGAGEAGDFDSVLQFYDGFAHRYDEEADRLGLTANHILGQMLSELAIRPARALDLGAGTGLTVQAVLGSTNPKKVVAVEASQGMSAHLKDIFKDDPRVSVAEVSALGYLDTAEKGSFDLVTAIYFAHFLKRPKEMINKAAGVLAPGGWLAMTYDVRVPGMPDYDMHEKPLDIGITVYKAECHEIDAALGLAGLATVVHERFVSQSKGNREVPCAFVMARKPVA